MRISDWSSDVCSSDLVFGLPLSIFQRPDSMFMISWAVLIIVVVCLWFLSLSHFGTLTLAIKNNEERVRFLGYETLLPRAIIIAFSAFIAAIGGALFALYKGFVTPMALHWSLSGEALVIALIGEIGRASCRERVCQ